MAADEQFSGYAADGPLCGQWLVSRSMTYHFRYPPPTMTFKEMTAKPRKQKVMESEKVGVYRYEDQNRDGTHTAGTWRLQE